jgi:glucose/arabinose dehydrogenase
MSGWYLRHYEGVMRYFLRSFVLYKKTGLVIALILAASCLPASANAAGVGDVSAPTGFSVTAYDGGVEAGNGIAEFDTLPGDNMIAISGNGKLMYIPKQGAARALAGTSFTQTPVLSVDPNFAASHVIYLSDSYSNLEKWVVDFDSTNTPIDAQKQSVIAQGSIRDVTGILANKDGTLWVGTRHPWYFSANPGPSVPIGDSGFSGKILHINQDGAGVATNPFFDKASPSSDRSSIYASGFAQPSDLTIDSSTGQLTANDEAWNVIGDGAFRGDFEFNFIQPGKSYGWPCWSTSVRFVTTPDDPRCASIANTLPEEIIPGDDAANHGYATPSRYTGTDYPAVYQGKIITAGQSGVMYGDYVDGKLMLNPFVALNNTGPYQPNGSKAKIHFMPSNGDVVFSNGSGYLTESRT